MKWAMLTMLLLVACGEREDKASTTHSDSPVVVSASLPSAANSITTPVRTAQPVSPPPHAVAKSKAPRVAPHLAPQVSRETTPTAQPDARAIGTEPFWATTVRGAVATLERPGHPPRHYRVVRYAYDRTIRYIGDGFSLLFTQGTCTDGMSDASWPAYAQLSFDEGVMKGCGGEKDERREIGV